MNENKAVELIGVDVNMLLNKLTEAFADEWAAAYQYWMCAKFAKGKLRANVVAEMMEHYHEEMKHANMLVDRIIQLGGPIDLFHQRMHKACASQYDALKNMHVTSILQENLKGERCAIGFYNDILKMVKGSDFITYHIILQILADEIKHEQDLVQLLEDIAAH
jgi:bacterioferritin